MQSNDKLLSVSEADYGDRYRDHCLTMYEGYVESADKISDRRHSANTFFLTVNTALLGITGYLQADGAGLLWLAALAGVVLSYTWYRLIKSYQSMNTAKFQVIHEMEKQLPFALYDAEWEQLGGGRNSAVHTPFGKVEARVPIVFIALHSIAAATIIWCYFAA
jgi:hypothetical protein